VPNAPSDVVSASVAAKIPAAAPATDAATPAAAPAEIGGPAGPEPTRFGDWEKNGRCVDF
jgi:hypothetical protein